MTGAIFDTSKASVNHDDIAQGFSQCLEEISQEIKPAEVISSMFDNERIRFVVRDLYGHYLSFLAASLEWFTAKVIKKTWVSLNRNYYKEMQGKVEKIRRIIRMMFREAEIGHWQLYRDEAISMRHTMEQSGMELRDKLNQIEMTVNSLYVFALLAAQIIKSREVMTSLVPGGVVLRSSEQQVKLNFDGN